MEVIIEFLQNVCLRTPQLKVMEETKILIIEDEQKIDDTLKVGLAENGYHVEVAYDGKIGERLFFAHDFNLVILDINLPGVNGYELAKIIRARNTHIPIIMLTARGEEIDRVIGFELGADDYVSKPFSQRELILRVKSIFRRMKEQRSDMLRAGRIQVYPARRQCFLGSREVELTSKEFDLLQELMLGRGNVLTRAALMDKVWGYHGEAVSRTLDTHVRRLREKLGQDGLIVETVRGVGYRIETSVEDS